MTRENQKKHDDYLALHGRDSIPASNYFINHKNFTGLMVVLTILVFIPGVILTFTQSIGMGIFLSALIAFVWWLQITSIKEVKQQGLW